MATLTCFHHQTLVPFNSRDALALEEMFQGLEGDPLREIETLLRDRFSSRPQPKTNRQKPN